MGIHYLPTAQTVAPAETSEYLATTHPQERPKWELPGKDRISEPLDIRIADGWSQLPGCTISVSSIVVSSQIQKWR